MEKINQKGNINIKFSDGLGIFDDHYGYPEIDDQETYNGPTGKVADIQGIQAHAGRNFFVPEGKEFCFDIDECPYLHIAIKAEEGTNTCLILCVHDKEPREHVRRPVVIGKTPEGESGIYDVIKDCFEIRDDGEWHEYDFDLRKIREKQDDKYPCYPDAGSVSIIQFYSWTGSGEHIFHFNDLFSKQESQPKDTSKKTNAAQPLISPIKPTLDTAVPGRILTQPFTPVALRTEISGCVKHASAKDRSEIAGLRIEVRADADQMVITYVVTDEKGCFRLSLDQYRQRDDRQERIRFVRLCVLRDGERLPIAQGRHYWRIEYLPKKIELQIASREGIIASVTGTVVHRDGTPIPNLGVSILRKGVRKDDLLGQGKTDSDGEFFITYDPKEDRPDIFVQITPAVGQNLKTEPLALSEVRFDAASLEHFDFVIEEEKYRGAPQFASLQTDVARVLGDTKLEELEDKDIEVLARKGRMESATVRRFVTAKKLAEESGISHETAYALLGQEEAATLDAVLALPPDQIEAVLSRAAAEDIVSPTVGKEAKDTVARLKQLRIDRVASGASGTVGTLLDIVGLNASQKKNFTSLYLDSKNRKDIWDTLAKGQTFTKNMVQSLRLTFEVDDLTGHHPPLIKALLNTSKPLKSGRELARLSKEEWDAVLKTRVDGKIVGVPATVQGKDENERMGKYVQALMRKAEAAYPTAAVHGAMKRLDAKQRQTVVQFLDNLEDFDFEKSHVKTFLKQKAVQKLYKASEQKQLEGDLKELQRVFRISPPSGRYEVMRTLLENGYDSAFRISRVPRDKFIQEIAQYLPAAENQPNKVRAARIFDCASTRAHLAVGAFSIGVDNSLSPGGIMGIPGWADFELLDPNTYPDDPDLGVKIAEYRELFGSIDFCACKHCESVFGPAAYLVDLLEWLRTRGLLDRLIANDRRPDIPKLKLTCSNTDGLIPHIDLLNEILEQAVAPSSEVGNTPSDYSVEELLAQPVYLNELAYNTLKTQTPPRDRALDLWESYAGEFLAHLGVSRLDILDAFGSAPNVEATLLLNVTWSELAFVLQNMKAGIPPQDGSYANNWMSRDNYIVSRFLSTTGLNQSQLLDLLFCRAANYNRTIKIEYDPSLSDNPDQTDEGCDLGLWRLRFEGRNPTKTEYLRLHRFLTLWRGTGWSMLELDKAVMVLSGNNATIPNWSNAIRGLSGLIRLMRMTGVEPLPLLSLWSQIDIERDRSDAEVQRQSLYAQIFQNPALGKDAAAFDLSDGTKAYIRDHRPALQAALGITGAELRALELQEFGRVPEVKDPKPGHKINLSNLTRLYRHTVLAKALGTSVREALIWQQLLPMPPSSAPYLDTEAFIRRVGEIKETGLDAGKALYYFHHDAAAAARLELAESEVARRLWDVRVALREMNVDDAEEQQPALLPLREYLIGSSTESAFVEDALAVIAGTSTKAVSDQETIVDRYFAHFLDAQDAKTKLVHNGLAGDDRWRYVEDAARRIQLEANLKIGLKRGRIAQTAHQPIAVLAQRMPQPAEESDAAQLIERHLKLAIRPSEGRRKLVENGGQLLEAEERFAYLNARLVHHNERISELEKVLARALEINALIVRDLLQAVSLNGQPLINVFLAPEFIVGKEASAEPPVTGIDPDLNVHDQTEAFRAFAQLIKIAGLYRQLRIGCDLHGWLVDNAESLRIARPWLLPSDENAASIPHQKWRRLVDLARLERKLPGSEPALPQILAHLVQYNAAPAGQDKTTALEALIEALAIRTNWSPEEVRYVLVTVLDLSNPAVVLYPGDLFRVTACCDLIRRTGASARQLHSWCGWLDSSHAFDIRQAVASRFDQKQWLEVSRGIHDRLRVKQRDALIAYLINNDTRFKDANAIYAHFLIDPEMNPCRETSRVLQAISSVQLFVQRHLLGLEGAQTLTDADAKAWKWWKNYRVWEANRKIFFYPENYIHPELRKDRSELFKNLEHELGQSELSGASGDRALEHYVNELCTLSNLEIVGLYLDGEPENLDDFNLSLSYWYARLPRTSTLHIIGRTKTAPHRYYYRTWHPDITAEGERWSTWTSINLDINAKQVIPIVRWDRLFLFWFTSEASSGEVSEIEARATRAKATVASVTSDMYQTFRFYCSEFMGDHWASPRISDPVETEVPGGDLRRLWLMPRESYNWYLYYSSRYLKESIVRLILVDTGWYRSEFLYGELHELHGDAIAACDLLAPKGAQLCRLWQWSWGYNSYIWGGFSGGVVTEHGRWRMSVQSSSNLMTTKVPGVFLDPGEWSYENKSWEYWLKTPAHRIFENTAVWERGFGESGGDPAAWVVPAYGKPSHYAFGVGDRRYSFLVTLKSIELNRETGDLEIYSHYKARRIHHPFAELFAREMSLRGTQGLLAPVWYLDRISFEQLNRQQLYNEKPAWDDDIVDDDYHHTTFTPAIEEIDFDAWRPNAMYNWEIFFHNPFLIAERLRYAQRSEEAMHWYHYIFEPMNRDAQLFEQNLVEDVYGNPVPAKRRYWKFRPFLTSPGSPIQILMRQLGDESSSLHAQIREWAANPFDPHAIASIRTSAYQKAIVMRYLDNLLEWGDRLFRQYTHESINEATQLYILAAEILGERPWQVKRPGQRPELSYDDLRQGNQGLGLDDFANVLVPLENSLPETAANTSSISAANDDVEPVPQFTSLYFCVPPNDELLEYWKKVEERLYKIRHCLDIEGIERPLPLWQPPIDPDILVRATAAGVDIDAVLAYLYAPLPPYRFNIVLQKALALTGSVRQLGSALQSTLEKRDAEELAVLRSSLEMDVLKAILEVRKDQRNEASTNIAAAQASKRVVEERKKHYTDLIDKGLIQEENDQLEYLERSRGKQSDAEMWDTIASIMGATPDASVGGSVNAPGPGGSMNWGGSFGGHNLAAIFSAVARVITSEAKGLEYSANRMSIVAGQFRREEDWNLQLRLADLEIKQLEKQIAAAEIRKSIAEKEISNHELQIENAKQIHEWMHLKFTNQELYEWMHGQLKGIYYQSYNVAYDMAKRAERCYRYELGITDARPVIEYGNWDNQREGLLAAERLQAQLERLDATYLEKDRRTLELTKHISLALLDPVALLAFREAGVCQFSLPEVLFDLDLPGHYMRRIKSVSLSIPAVTGPYTNISATLTMQSSWIRRQAGAGELEMETGVNEAIVTSSARNDAGVFQLNQQDPRYLPFERRGAISDWKLELTETYPSFDRRTISDVILHLEYTALDGGELFRGQRRDEVRMALNELTRHVGPKGLSQWFDVRRVFPDVWHQFLNAQPIEGKRSLTLSLTPEHLPYMFRGANPTVDHVGLLLSMQDTATPHAPTTASISLGAFSNRDIELSSSMKELNNQLFGHCELKDENDLPSPQPWGKLSISLQSNVIEALQGVNVLVFYSPGITSAGSSRSR